MELINKVKPIFKANKFTTSIDSTLNLKFKYIYNFLKKQNKTKLSKR